jgi:VWFA-related protein
MHPSGRLGVIKYPIAIASIALMIAGCASRGGSNQTRNESNQIKNAETVEPCRLEPSPLTPHPAGYREIFVEAKTSDGTPVRLERVNLRLKRDGQDIAIQSFVREPASVGIVVDTSGSMEPKLANARAALTDLINGLAPNDDIFLFAFADKTYMLQNRTTNHEFVLQKLSILRAFGDTALFDTIIEGLSKIRHGCHERKALFVLTDGIDNVSSLTREEVISTATSKKLPIYSIGIGNSNATPAAMPFGAFTKGDIVDMKTLKALADATGGKTYLVHEVGDGELLKKDAALIADAISNQYSIGFVAASAADLKLELRNHPGVTLAVGGAQITIVNAANPTHQN